MNKPLDDDKDISLETDAAGAEAEGVGGSVKRLREKLKLAIEEKQEYLAGWQRAKADLINFKREAEEARERHAQFACVGLILDLLPVLDSFHMAMRSPSWAKGDPEWKKGVEYIAAQLISALEAQGVKEIDPLGEPFDPNIATAVEHVEVSDPSEDGVIVQVLQKGYRLKGKDIRTAKVNVGSFKK